MGPGDRCAPASNLFAGSYEHLIRLTLARVSQATGEACSARRIADAHAALMAEADRIHDTALRHSFLTRIAEHRQTVALHTRQLVPRSRHGT